MFDDLNAKLKAGEITVAEWESGVRGRLYALYLAALLLLTGGSPTPADYLLMTVALEVQYSYLSKFAADIASDPDAWLTGRLDARLALYAASAYAAYELFRQSLVTNAGFTEERRVLGIADHCHQSPNAPGCVELASKGWQPIGTLPKIGSATCRTNCRCHFEYRKPTSGGGWIIESES